MAEKARQECENSPSLTAQRNRETAGGTPRNCEIMLRAGACVAVFPEGARGANKPFRKRYQLQPFGMGFMRLARRPAQRSCRWA